MFSVGMVGLGKIAAMYGTPEEGAPYCHAGGIRHSERVRLAAVCDVSAAATGAFQERWGACFPGLHTYGDLEAMLEGEELDVVAVCVRGPQHFDVTMRVLAAGPRAVFLEKPPGCSLAETDAMAAAAAEQGIPITVSYSRHWAPHVLRLQELVQEEGLIGEVRSVVAYTGGAFLSFASHVTDLICQFAGYCPTAITARGHDHGEAAEGYEGEPALDGALVEFASGVTALHVGQQGEHGGFYCDVLGTEGLVRAGIYAAPFARGQGGPVDLAALGMPPNASVFQVAYEQIADHLEGGPRPHCTDRDWHVVNELGFAGIESVRTGRRVELPVEDRRRRIYANG